MTTQTFLRALCVALALSGPLVAQEGLFSAVIVVNDGAVTGWEIDQRIRLLQAFNTPGDLPEEARTQLVEDRLKQQELERRGVVLDEPTLARAIDDFAARAGVSGEEFTAQLGAEGIAPETLRDYVATNVAWRDYVRARFGDDVEVTEPEVDQALAQRTTQSQGIEVLLSEIIIPAPPGQEAQALALARRIAQVGTTAEFEAAAREVSAVASAENGGRLDWSPLSNYPEALGEVLLALRPGEVTAPLTLQGAVALLQLRDLRQGAAPTAQPESVDYAMVRIPGGRSPEALALAARIDAATDTCTDLFGLGLPPASIARQSVAPAALPAEVALDLATLDPGEATWGRTDTDGALLLTVLCGRTYPLPEGASDRAGVTTALQGTRLQAYADALLADLRASATIVGE
ncbi:peptidylprolyl isomerase [Rubellimicrobium aerolatum]|uniref:Parvulin-like PPIase n=1 Tax=Rubellimicrobium aerolatum TaxID=490979 RepID=A0ABW0SBC8_9RHOB|nr:peptidylprolyl isomerase [Rubellimicrobium aerolatum]MBP1805471.1 peptidyl-prolyl cis-trans isomerase SurA [Rubellimicrobium aerolatum]